MLSKNNVQAYQPKESKQRFGLRKLSIGVASVLLGTTFMWGSQIVHADTNADQPVTTNEQLNNKNDNLQSQTMTLNQQQPSNTTLTDQKVVNKALSAPATSEEPVSNKAWQNVPKDVTPGSNQANSQNFNPSQFSFKDGKPVTVSSADGRYTLNWQSVITGNSGTEAWNADRHTTLAVSANVQAGDVLQVTIGQNSTMRLDWDSLAPNWGTLTVRQGQQSDSNDVYTTRAIFTYTFKKKQAV